MTGRSPSWALSSAIVVIGLSSLVVYGSYVAEIKAAFTATAPAVNTQAEHEYRLGLEYATGSSEQDRQKAIALVTLSAEHGFGEAQFLLADAYYRGEVVQDYRWAYIWFTLALHNGLAKAATSRYEVAAYLSPAELTAARQEVERLLAKSLQ